MNVDWAPRPGDDGYADPAFPALASLLAPIVPGRAPVAVYYYPGRTLQVTHADGAGGLVTRDAVPVGADARPASVLGPGERWDAALRCTVRTWPHDPGLPGLPRLVAELGAAEGDVLSYLPGLRAVLRVQTPDGPVVVKAADPGAAESLRRNHSRHAVLHATPDRGFGVSRPLDVDEARVLRREELLPGTSPVRALAAGASPAGLAAAVAAALVALHALPPHDALHLADHSAAGLLSRWQRKTLRTIGRALPGLAPRATAVVDALDAGRPAGLGAAPGVVHGDLHTANVLVGPDGVTLLDLDSLGTGDPELDVAVLVGRLLLVAAAGGDPHGDVTTAARAVVPAYDDAAAAAGRPGLRPDVLAWYLAGTLVGRQVRTSVRHLAPGLDPLCTRLVGLAEGALRVPPSASAAAVVGAVADLLPSPALAGA